jgi:hypothetical protein
MDKWVPHHLLVVLLARAEAPVIILAQRLISERSSRMLTLEVRISVETTFGMILTFLPVIYLFIYLFIYLYRGWTDDEGNEFAIAGCSDGTSFVDVTNPDEPVVLGFLKGTTLPSSWRDMKVFKNYAYIGSEAPNHGLQVFDMTQLTSTAKAYREKMSRVRLAAKRDISTEGHINLGNSFNATTTYAEFGEHLYPLFC